MSSIPLFITLLRLIVPFSILRSPFWGILASMYADAIDWDIIGIRSKEMDAVYQNWDKSLDAYTYFFIVWVVLRWKDAWARNTALLLFGVRMVGLVIFRLTAWRPILFFFPNVFENFVLLCLILFWWSKKQKLSLNSLQKVVMMGVLIVPKVIQEYFQHFLGRQPWELYGIAKQIGFQQPALNNVDSILWIVLLYIFPISGFLLWLSLPFCDSEN